MPLTKQQKGKILDDVRDRASRADFLVFANYHGLNVAEVSKLRKSFREKGVEYKVVKKTLLQRVLEEKNIDGFDANKLQGELGVIFGYNNAIETASLAWQFAKSHKDSFKILGAVFENKVYDIQMVETLAHIPSREVLLGQVVYLISSPLRGMVTVLQGNMRNLLGVLSNIQK